jgi:Uma2 family endonuclease
MSIPLVEQSTEEKLVTLKNVSWEQFKGIEAHLQDNRNVRLSYLSGVLEIMSPIGEKHEEVKSTLSLLLEAYMRVLGIRFYKQEVDRSGFFPDLDPSLLLHYIAMPNQYDAVVEFEQTMRNS